MTTETKTKALLDEFVDATHPRKQTWSSSAVTIAHFLRWLITENKDVTNIMLPTPERCTAARNDGALCPLLDGDKLLPGCPYCITLHCWQEEDPDIKGDSLEETLHNVISMMGCSDSEKFIHLSSENEKEYLKFELVSRMVDKYDSEVKSGVREDVPIPGRGPWAKMTAEQRFDEMNTQIDALMKEKGVDDVEMIGIKRK
jgi:hypothetical protein